MVMDMARFYQIGRPSGWPAGIAERRSAYRRQGPGAAVGTCDGAVLAARPR
jgi:hypothetical protein